MILSGVRSSCLLPQCHFGRRASPGGAPASTSHMDRGLRLYSWGAVEIDEWHSELVRRVGSPWPCPPSRVGPRTYSRGSVEEPTSSLRAAEELEVQIADVHLPTS